MTASLLNEEHYIVYWEGPYEPKELLKKAKKKCGETNSYSLPKREAPVASRGECWVLYAAYGTHKLYGRDVLLYLGMTMDGKTKRGIEKRFYEHDGWFDEQLFGETKYIVGSIMKFSSWDEYDKFDRYEPLSRETVEKIEQLLIYALKPANNDKNKKSALKSKLVRIFNTGSIGDIPPEISGVYHYGVPETDY